MKNENAAYMTGNEAIAYGARDAGLHIASGYPGNPSTEIMETLQTLEGEHKAFWHTNEKTALEMCLGCALRKGTRSMATMKHVGLNVAADAFKSIAVTGVEGALVLVVSDDRGMYSSQNEFDSRTYAHETGSVVLEPSDSQEAYDMIREAFELSEKIGNIIVVRMTVFTSHGRGKVVFGEKIAKSHPEKILNPDPKKFSVAPFFAVSNVKNMYDLRIPERRKIAEKHSFNFIEGPKKGKLGVIAAGVAYHHLKEVGKNKDIPILKLGLSLPLPLNLVRTFAKSVDRLILVDDGYVLEQALLLAGVEIFDKAQASPYGETNPDKVNDLLIRTGINENTCKGLRKTEAMPRILSLCAGCPYRGMTYALKNLGKAVLGDIGCYTLTSFPPFNVMSTAVEMGASIPMAEGAYWTNPDDKPVCMIGDGTFLHSGVTGLIGAVNNKSQITIIILDNGTIAMTGCQDTALNGNTDLKALLKSVGVEDIHPVDAYDYHQCVDALVKAEDYPGVSVIVVQGECVFLRKKENKTSRPKMLIKHEACVKCGICADLCCPAFYNDANGNFYINQSLCDGCGICRSVCRPCPLGNEVEKIALSQKRKNYIKTINLIYKNNPFPRVACSLCKEFCAESAIQTKGDEYYDGHSETGRFFKKQLQNMPTLKPELIKLKINNQFSGEKTAVVGAGVAGLTAARILALQGCHVDIYEASNMAGGLTRQVIPTDRIDRENIESPPKSPNFRKSDKFGGLLTIRRPEFFNSEAVKRCEIFQKIRKRLFGGDSILKTR